MIPLNDFRRLWNHTHKRALEVFAAVGESGWYIPGDEVRGFVAELARQWGIPFCVGVASGLDALEIALRVLGCGRGDKVLTTSVSAFATNVAILKLGAVPVLSIRTGLAFVNLETAEAALAQAIVQS